MTMILASLIGTYLDLIIVGKGFYSFPSRPFPTIFSIDILFTLFILPLFTLLTIWLMEKLHAIGQGLMLAILFIIVPFVEHLSEHFGTFAHSSEWNHLYSGVGYVLFILVMSVVYKWASA
jgi:uncharacterized membrane protein (UPF0182 family)